MTAARGRQWPPLPPKAAAAAMTCRFPIERPRLRLRLRLRGKGQITLRGLVRTIAPAKGKLWEEDASWQA